MKDKTTNNLEIKEWIKTSFIQSRNFISASDVERDYDLLCDNGEASKITFEEDHITHVTLYKVASKFMIKHNKFNKKFILQEINEERILSLPEENKEISKLKKYILSPGVYYAELKNENYACFISEKDKYEKTFLNGTLYFIGKDHQKYMKKIFSMYKEYKKLSNNNKTSYLSNLSDRDFSPTIFKPFDKMVFKDKEKVLEYIDNWKINIPNYYQYGMIPKLSILLYGEPGTGKSTFYKALAKYLGLNVVNQVSPDYFVDSGRYPFGDEKNHIKKRHRRSVEYSESILAIDDIDCIAKNREKDDSNENGQILSKLLEFLDNPPTFYYRANDGIDYPVSIVVATTNYYDRLDEAVKRFGRFDLTIKMDHFNYEESEQFASLWDLNLEDLNLDIKNKKTFLISPAKLQAICMENIDKKFKKV